LCGENALSATAVRLTQDRSSQSGWLWSRLPLTPSSFEVEWEFRVDGKSNTLYGDGFAVWLTRGRAQDGPVFGSADKWEGLGIFFDTCGRLRFEAFHAEGEL
jgi:mannose-binding lectin 2